MEKHNNKLRESRDSTSVGQYQSENSQEIQSKDIPDTEAKINASTAATPENLVIKAAEVDKVDTESHGRVEFILKLDASIETSKIIESFAVPPDKKIYITTKSHFLCYKSDLTKKIFEEPRIVAANATAVVISRLHQASFLVLLDINKRVLNIISLETNSLVHVHPVRRQDPMPFLASSGHYLACAFNQGGNVSIEVLSIDDRTATVISQPHWKIQIPLPIRSMSMSISGSSGCPVVVWAHRFMIGKTSKHQPALVSTVLGEKDVSSETITFGELDPNAYAFDLRCLHSIAGLIFAFNVKEDVVYRVMKSGKRSERVTYLEFLSEHSCTEFSAAKYIHLDVGPKEGDMYVWTLSRRKTLSSFKLITGSVL